ncbi:MAG TPA: hypothetical protein VME21_03040, partial [Steroidobacteraceae bacterium]|nr:hypothetical protein [Steroidobacteraceae bacterium]
MNQRFGREPANHIVDSQYTPRSNLALAGSVNAPACIAMTQACALCESLLLLRNGCSVRPVDSKKFICSMDA